MQVRDLMTEAVVTCPADASLETAAEEMIERRVGSVIVTDDGDPTGILTETDAMHAGAVTDRPFAGIELREVASSPLHTVGPRTTVRSAVDRMQSLDVKKLPVVRQLELVGVLTLTDVVYGYSDIVREAQDAATLERRWETDSDRWRLDGSERHG
ncbi:CBS domain-containing protein [Halobaculum sp. MBLA0143]|uniref:CBS domain-containing protein n=1 Tax=Halobaculum sp. MBLA0143 TaxID=3079933 RepID=UPI003525DE5A